MLKLERISRDQQIHISLREGDSLFSRSFMMALAIALSMHLIGFLLFHVSNFKFHSEGNVLPPVHVESDLDAPLELIDSVITANNERDLAPLREYLEQKEKLPPFPKPYQTTLVIPLEFSQNESPSTHPFMHLESDLLFSERENMALQPGIAIKITGNLTEKDLMSDFKERFSLSMDIPQGYYQALYNVQIEGKTGHIFWLEPKVSTGHDLLDKFVEKMLFELQFKKKIDFVETALVEVLFYHD